MLNLREDLLASKFQQLKYYYLWMNKKLDLFDLKKKY